jgi:hypothetical protein
MQNNLLSILTFRAINLSGILMGKKEAIVTISAKDIIMEIRAINVMAGMGSITVIGITTGITNKIFSIGLGS